MSGKQHFRSDNDDDRVKKNPAIKKPRRPTPQDLMDAWLTDDSEEYGSENLSDTIGLSSQRLVPDTVGYKRDFMKLSDYLVEDALIDELQADEKEDAIRELVESLVQVGELEASELDS
ncbi:MAG: hypothetical protein O2857_28730, partial [Planctomycetota bacterium]|nr:hypothetical protein [Planctomycetota bacterium]